MPIFFAILAVAEGVVTFSSNGYKDVVVSISPNVDGGADQNVTVDNIKVKPRIICQMASCCYYLR